MVLSLRREYYTLDLAPDSVMAGHSPPKTGVNALVPGHPDQGRRDGAFLSGMPGTRPGMTDGEICTQPAVFSGQRHKSLMMHLSHSGLRAMQV